MPRNMSFFLTTLQIGQRTKTITRRMGWRFLKPGDEINAVVKAQGLKKGEKVKRLARLRVVSVRREGLHLITQDDVGREGFQYLSPLDFVEMFAEHNRCEPTAEVTRIEFEYV